MGILRNGPSRAELLSLHNCAAHEGVSQREKVCATCWSDGSRIGGDSVDQERFQLAKRFEQRCLFGQDINARYVVVRVGHNPLVRINLPSMLDCVFIQNK